MDSYDEVHFVKDGREITTPELDVSGSIKFVNEVEDEIAVQQQPQRAEIVDVCSALKFK